MPSETDSSGTGHSLGDERKCPGCGGRQVVTSVGRASGRDFIKTGEDWICTDRRCDRRDIVSEMEQERGDD